MLRVAEHRLGGGVEEGDHSLLVTNHDGIARLFGELPVARLGGSQRLFSPFALGDLLHKPLVLSADRGLAQGGHDVPAELVGKPRRDRAAGQQVNAESGVHLKRINLAIGSRAWWVDDERVDGYGGEPKRRGQAGEKAKAWSKPQDREDDEDVIGVGRRVRPGPGRAP